MPLEKLISQLKQQSEDQLWYLNLRSQQRLLTTKVGSRIESEEASSMVCYIFHFRAGFRTAQLHFQGARLDQTGDSDVVRLVLLECGKGLSTNCCLRVG